MGKYGRHHIGKTFNDGKLVVVDGGSKVNSLKVKCLVCAKDPELYGDGVFETMYSRLMGGSFPCGCAKRCNWTLHQYEIRIKRKIELENLPIKFIGFGESGKYLKNTSVKLFCTNKNTSFEVSSIDNFFQGNGNNGITWIVEGIANQYCREHIGRTFNDGKLRVVDGGNSQGHVLVKCSECAKDAELFDEGIFEVNLMDLGKGGLPCGCSVKVNWTLEQHKIRINRKILEDKLPIRFVGFGEKVKPIGHTPVILYCEESKSEYTIGRVSQFYQGVGTKGKVYTTKERLEEYSKLNPNYTVWETGKRSKLGDVIIGFHCQVCESNGYESLFTAFASNIFGGSLPCYCSPKISRMSGSHIVAVSERKLHEQGIKGVNVIGGIKKAGAWYSVFICETHGIYSRKYLDIYSVGCHCLKCTPPITGYDKTKLGSLYLLEIQTDSSIILGYGITNKLNNRLTTHRKNLNNLGYKILSTRIFEGSGTKVLAVENSIKALHKTGLIDCEGFRRESISIDMKEEVLEKCAGLTEISLDTQ